MVQSTITIDKKAAAAIEALDKKAKIEEYKLKLKNLNMTDSAKKFYKKLIDKLEKEIDDLKKI